MALTRITKGVIKPNENYDTHNINSTGIVTAVSANFTGDVNVGGVLTYEDVTSIDSVGIITARVGIDCNGDIDVDGHTNLDNVSVTGVSTFSDGKISFNEYGDISGRYFNLSQGDGTKYIDANLANGNQLSIRGYVGNNFHHMADFVRGGLVGLNYSGNRKLETSAKGITVGTGVTIETNGQATFSGITTFSDNVNVVTGKKINFGNINGTQGHIYFDGSTTRLQTNHGLNIGSPVCVFKSANLGETMVEAVHNAHVKLWYDYSTYNTPKLETTATGVTIDGTVVAGGLDISGDIDVDGHTNLDNVSIAGVSTFTGMSHHSSSLQMLNGNNIVLQNDANSANCQIDCYGGAGFRLTSYNQTMFTCENGSNTKFYTDSGTSRLEITHAGNVLVNTGALHIPDALTHLGDTDTQIRFPAADTIRFEVGNQQAVHILPSSAGSGGARMGLGTNNPTGMLHIYGANPPFRIQNSNDSANLQIGMWDASNVMFQVSHRPFKLATETSHPIVFHTGGLNNERLRINTNGQVLIGTTTDPAYTNRRLAVATTSGTTAIEVRSATNGDGRIIFTDNTTSGNAGAYKGQIKYDQTSDYMSFNTNGDNERLRIESDGNIKAKTATQYKGFHLVKADGGTVAQLVGHASDNDEGGLNLWDGGVKKIQILAQGYSWLMGGNVGINTTTPTQRLVSYADSGYPFVANGPSNSIALNNAGVIVFGTKDVASYASGSFDATDYTFKISGTEKVKITSTGYVQTKSELWVGGSAPVLRWRDSTHGEKATARIGGSDLYFEVANNERLRITSAGRVGIGSDVPNRPLSIGVGDGSVALHGANSGIYLGTHPTGGFQNNAAIARAGANNYHIGGSTPGDLCIASESSAAMIFGVSHSPGAMDTFLHVSRLRNLNYYGQDYNFHIGSNVMLNIASNGNMALGSATNPGNALRYFDVGNFNTGSSAGSIIRLLTTKSDGTGAVGLDIVKYKSGGAYFNNYETLGTNGFIAFSTGQNGGTPTEALRIGADGEIRIRGAKSGNAVSNVVLTFDVLNSNGDSKKAEIKAIRTADITSELIFSTTVSHAYAERFRIDSSGNLSHSGAQFAQSSANNTVISTTRSSSGVTMSMQAISNPVGRVGTTSNHSTELVAYNNPAITLTGSAEILAVTKSFVSKMADYNQTYNTGGWSTNWNTIIPGGSLGFNDTYLISAYWYHNANGGNAGSPYLMQASFLFSSVSVNNTSGGNVEFVPFQTAHVGGGSHRLLFRMIPVGGHTTAGVQVKNAAGFHGSYGGITVKAHVLSDY